MTDGWSNFYGRKILKNVFQAMKVHSKLLIADAVLPPAGVLPRCQEEVLGSFDIVSDIFASLIRMNAITSFIEHARPSECPREDVRNVTKLDQSARGGKMEDGRYYQSTEG